MTPAATFVLAGSAFVIGALAFATRPSSHRFGAALIPMIALTLVAAAGAVQLVPIPMERLRSLAPVSASTYADANRVLALFGRPALQQRVSIAPTETYATILLILAYVVLFAAAAILCSTPLRRRVIAAAFLGSVLIHILYATANAGPSERIHGTFVNPNHFAGYLQIALAVSFGVIWREILHNRERGAGVRDLADRLEKRVVPLAGPIILWSVTAAGIALTRSRGGILAAVLTTVTLVVIAPLHRTNMQRTRRAAIAVVLAVAAGVAFVVFTTGEAPVLRFLGSDPRDIGSDTRTAIWSASITASTSSPLLGTGLGTFREAFRRVQPPAVVGLVEQAHNDFLQILVTGGWVCGALVAIAIAALLTILIRGWLEQRHREESAFALAGIGAILSLVLHGLVEFNMSIPAIPATLAVISGMSIAAANYDRTSGPASPLPGPVVHREIDSPGE